MSARVKATAKQRRLQELEAAKLRLKNRGAAINISSVAREAGVTPGLIHNTYPDFAEGLRALQGKSSRARADEIRKELIQARADNQQLRSELDTANREARKLASMLEGLRFELAKYKAAADGTVAEFPRPQKSS